MRHLHPIALLALLASCHSTIESRISPRLDAEVRSHLGSTREETPRFLLTSRERLRCGCIASCYDDYIVVAVDGHDTLDFFVAHELVHWYVVDSPFAGMPLFLEEGLADWIACDVTGHLEARIVESHLIGSVEIQPSHLYVDAAGWCELSSPVVEDLTRAGFDLIRRLGMERVRELALQGASADVYLREAGVYPPKDADPPATGGP
jgi:hypothetical protein